MEKPKRFILSMPEVLHKQVKTIAALESVSMNNFIVEAIQDKIKKEGKEKFNKLAE